MTAVEWDTKEFRDKRMLALKEQGDHRQVRLGLRDLDYGVHLAFRLGAKWLKNALKAYEQVFLLDAEDLHIINKNLVTHYRKKGNLVKSIEYLAKVIAAEDGNKKSKLSLTLGELYYLNNNLEQAKVMFKSYLVDHPASSKALVGLANIYAKQGEDDRALEHYEKTIQCDDQNHYAFYRLGILCDKKKDFVKATQWLLKAIALDPNNIKYNRSLGFVYETIHAHDEAVPYFKRVMEIENERWHVNRILPHSQEI